MTALDPASAAQIQAADPMLSTWLSANAGSGKTRVLTDRVARILLRDVSPQNILCLTFTKAAAAEMQNRLFARLGKWSMLDDNSLRAALASVGEPSASGDQLARARRLFARAIETPGGLKIQTIHSFCSSILRRFPLEAGVPPGFTELDDLSAKSRLREALDSVAVSEPETFDAFAALFSGLEIEAFSARLAGQREAFAQPVSFETIAGRIGLPEGYDEARLLDEVFLGGEEELVAQLLPHLMAGSNSDAKAGTQLADLPSSRLALLDLFDKRFVGQSGKSAGQARIGTFPTKATRERMPPELLARLEALMLRVASVHDRAKMLRLARRSHTLNAFARVLLPAYEAAKTARGELDFDDLILKARDLLTQAEVAEWVLFRLDGGIDHILVDEAQDTGPAQWQVVELISREITAGSGRLEAGERTIFVVGDKKQSIYGFQGADPDGFERMASIFSERLGRFGAPPQRRELHYSFRSAAPILRVVDEAFPDDPRAMGGALTHIAFHEQLPGRVDLWPFIPKPPKVEDDAPWYKPVDMILADDPQVQLAERIATEIVRMQKEEWLFEEDGKGGYRPRRITDGDILILVQRRALIFHEVIRACKAAGLEVAGADRVRLTDAIAVKDLIALLAFLDTPDDDLSLAAALRSPLFDWSEDAIYRLAQPRKGRLWQALREAGDKAEPARSILTDLRDHAGFLRPYELIERILTHHEGRPRLLARLGLEAEESIDLLLSTALSYEQSQVPSLTGFLTWIESSEIDIKRGQESGGRAIRVMTVHGAKGLEAPIVILAESGDRQSPREDGAVLIDGLPPLWKPSKADTPADLLPLLEELKEKQEEERLRLQYVAMTRAEQWLIVCGAGEAKEDKENWYRRTERALARVGAVRHLFPFGAGQRFANARPDGPEPEASAPETPTEEPVPLLAPAPAHSRPPQLLSPSALPGPKTLPGEGSGSPDAMARGTALHLLLEVLPALPPNQREAHGRGLLDRYAPDNDYEVLAEALTVLSTPSLAPYFVEHALLEVPITARLPAADGQPMQGVIDRLIVTESCVTAVDYKSNAITPKRVEDTPAGLLAQMGAYASALQQIYPDRRIQTALLWTRLPRLDLLPHDLVTNALKATASA